MATLLTTAAKDPTLPIEDRYHLAVACLKAGDRTGYRAACAGIAGRMPPAGALPDLGDAIVAAKAFALGSGATDDWAVPLAWADQILTRIAEREAADPSAKERNKPLRYLFLHVRGALLFRAGRPEEATAAALRDPRPSTRWTASSPTGCSSPSPSTGSAGRTPRRRPRPGPGGQAGAKPNPAWERAEVELLAAELDAALPPAGK